MYVLNSDIQVHATLRTTVRLLAVDRTITGRETATVELEGEEVTLRLGDAVQVDLAFDREMTQNGNRTETR